MIQLLGEGFLLGLAVGVSCLATCAPVYAPLLSLKERSWQSGLKAILVLCAGRFLAYAAFGAAAGGAGSLLPEQAVGRHLLIIASYAALSLYLLFTSFVQLRRERDSCAFRRLAKFSGSPFLVGLLTGFSVCPAFLLALARGLDAGGALGGLSLFVGFFAGTTLYLLPIAAVSLLTKRRWFRLAGLAASALVAAWYLWLAGLMAYYLVAAYR